MKPIEAGPALPPGLARKATDAALTGAAKAVEDAVAGAAAAVGAAVADATAMAAGGRPAGLTLPDPVGGKGPQRKGKDNDEVEDDDKKGPRKDATPAAAKAEEKQEKEEEKAERKEAKEEEKAERKDAKEEQKDEYLAPTAAADLVTKLLEAIEVPDVAALVPPPSPLPLSAPTASASVEPPASQSA
ncbi:MAG: hypothetical protein VKS61_06870 [Candidatus Sericytochromatia bacterium]|nr:hypothetical protein [Candidatus Sericytochromatia bacterium]